MTTATETETETDMTSELDATTDLQLPDIPAEQAASLEQFQSTFSEEPPRVPELRADSDATAMVRLAAAEGRVQGARRSWRLGKLEYHDHRRAAEVLGIRVELVGFLDWKMLLTTCQHEGQRGVALVEGDNTAVSRRFDGEKWSSGNVWDQLPASAPGWLGAGLVPGGRKHHGSRDPIIVTSGGAQTFLDLTRLLLERRLEIAPLVATDPAADFTDTRLAAYLVNGRPMRVVFDPGDARQVAAAERWIDALAGFEVTVSRHPIPEPESLSTIFRGPRSEAGRDLLADLLRSA